ncbi:MAG: hypothetical protein HY282_05670 [Nitrospirae bacterium]|nr:hypothetical protein [Candidatus Manganitrophaceae bacterium]
MARQTQIKREEASHALGLKELVTNKVELWKVSDRLNVNPSTIQKIIEGSPVSRSVTKKIEAALQEGRGFDGGGKTRVDYPSNHSSVERLMEVYDLYEAEKSLRTVGEQLGLSRERVRQLLEKGSEIGLFKYRPAKAPLLSREKILKDYGRFLKRSEVAKANRISTNYLSKLIELHEITKSDLNGIRMEGWKRRCLKQYQAFAGKLGYHPTTTELQQSKVNRSLAFKIRRLWGSLETFRSELNLVPGMPVEGRSRERKAVLAGV